MEKFGPIRQRSPISTLSTGVSRMQQYRLMKVERPIFSLVP
jgi:hypothetical protein